MFTGKGEWNMRVENHKLAMEAGDDFNFHFEPSPHVNSKLLGEERIIVIHAPGSGSVSGAASTNKTSGQSRHLIVGRDGRVIWQTLSFDKLAKHLFFAGAGKYDNKTIAIELEYPGELTRGTLPLDQYIRASPLNNSRYGNWPLYPKEQLDTLLRIVTTLASHYKITDVLGYEEIADHRKDPGPAFPIHQFREKLRRKLPKENKRFVVLQEMEKTVRLLGQPPTSQGEYASSYISNTEVPEGTPVSVINEMYDWYLISVIANVGGNSWLTGWVKKDAVRVKSDYDFAINKEHTLLGDGRRFQFIEPHRNGYTIRKQSDQPEDKPEDKPEKKIKYIILHFTTGLKMESTISHFKDPGSGVSTHLLIGRDGRVVQFLPFDRIAHHCGYSWWEGDEDINQSSIGIELDNAGLLSSVGDKWYSKKMEIPKKLVKRKWYWKISDKPKNEEEYPGWEDFPDVQKSVALSIVKAIKARYPNIKEILGHDDVNISNRYDPGPCFPMSDFRMALFGREEPDYMKYKIKDPESAKFYHNFQGSPPNVEKNRDESFRLPPNASVRVIRQNENMALISVVKSKEPSLDGKRGWVLKKYLATPSGATRGKRHRRDEAGDKKFEMKRATRPQVILFAKGDATPTPRMEETLKVRRETDQKDRYARVQKTKGEWALVVVLPTETQKGFEGWIRRDSLELIP
jgi:N-acetylmuramoyl-L-alanine amidase